MPFARIELFEGRSDEQKAAIAKEVAEVLLKHTGAPKSAIHIMINDMKEGTYFPEGEKKLKN